jgi:hypothetical protein
MEVEGNDMSPEKCSDCQRVFKEVKANHPHWLIEDRFKIAEQTLINVRKENKCGEKRCMPLEQAQRVLKAVGERVEAYTAPIPEPPKPEWMKKAEEVVELHILDQVHGHPDKFTAYSGAKGCGCGNCKRNLEAWKELYGK